MSILVAELATGHGGDVQLAATMIRAAAEAGANLVKLQTYSLARLNPKDPQANWLRRAYLCRDDHVRLMDAATDAGVAFMSTPFDAKSLRMLRDLGVRNFKIASSESAADWWDADPCETWYVSYPWGEANGDERADYALTAIPLYPTPLECVGRATLLDGWSDHCIGLAACERVLALGVSVLEVHLTIPGSRQMPWDKTPDDLRRLRQFAEDCATMSSGVSQTFRERWSASV